MTGAAVVGWVLMAVGILAILAGVVGGILTMFLDIRKQLTEGRSYGVGDLLPTAFIKALTEFLKALVTAPVWLALVFVGIFLVALGARMI